MRLERQPLLRLLASVTKAVPGRNTIPILATVRLIGKDGKLTVTGTDLDIEIAGSIPADGELAACVDAKLFAAAIGKIAGTEVELAVEDNVLVVKSGRSRYRIQTLPVDDFPTMSTGEFTAEFEADMASMFAPVAYAMSDEVTRYYLCGAYLEPRAVTATNGHKLSTVAHTLPDFAPVIVPSATVALAPKGNAKVRLSGTKIQFVTDDVTLTSKLIDGTYPDYERVIPRDLANVVVVDSAALKAAADRVAIVSINKTPSVRLDLSSEEVTISARGDSEATDTVPCAYDGPAQVVGFNAHYLVEVLGGLPAGPVKMAVGDCMGPVVFTSDAAPNQRVVLMPQRIGA